MALPEADLPLGAAFLAVDSQVTSQDKEVNVLFTPHCYVLTITDQPA